MHPLCFGRPGWTVAHTSEHAHTVQKGFFCSVTCCISMMNFHFPLYVVCEVGSRKCSQNSDIDRIVKMSRGIYINETIEKFENSMVTRADCKSEKDSVNSYTCFSTFSSAQFDCNWFILLRLILLPTFLFAFLFFLFFLRFAWGETVYLSSSEYFVCSVVYSEFFFNCLSGCWTDEDGTVCWCGSKNSRKFSVRRKSVLHYVFFFLILECAAQVGLSNMA